jgi:CHAD domain-containing protein
MLTKKKQRRYISEKERQWLDELVAFDESRDEEALHRLRLQIKKIRALVQLSGHVRGRRLAKDFRPLKKMFRVAGMIRDSRSQLRLLEEHKLVSPEYRERRVRELRDAGENFSRHVRAYRKQGKKAGRMLLADLHSIHSGRIRRWVANEIIRTGLLLTKSGDDLHLARKKIKALLYVQKILPQKMAAQLRLDRGYLDSLQDNIGKWHDMLVAATDWPDKSDAGEMQMMQECREKEQAVRALADDFYRRAHG